VELDLVPAVAGAMTIDDGIFTTRLEIEMDKDRVEGAKDKAKGSIKKGVGELTGDEKMKAEGEADKTKGKVKSTVGGMKDAVRESDRDRR
jgi:uncharacterized protein YjbJ (UPF0337 family)